MELHIIIVNDYDYIMIIHTQTILHKPHSISLKPYEFISLAVLSAICDNAKISSETIIFAQEKNLISICFESNLYALQEKLY